MSINLLLQNWTLPKWATPAPEMKNLLIFAVFQISDYKFPPGLDWTASVAIF